MLHMTRTRLDSRKVFRFTTVFLAGLALVALSGCKLAEVFSLSGNQSTMVTEGPVAKAQWDLFMITVWVTTGIFIVVGAVLAYAQIKFYAKDEDALKAEPPAQGHGNPLIEIGLIAASVGLLVIIAVPTVRDIWYTHDVPEAEKADAIDVTATGYQWWFKFEYNDPAMAVKLPAGGEAPLVTGNELVVPAGRPVRVHLRTIDVIHSFWIPKLAGKVDMMPNRANFLWFKANRPGYFYGQCAEYCGESHAIMKFRVIALDQADYDKWLANQKLPARTVAAPAAGTELPRVQFASFVNDGRALSASPTFDANPLAAWRKLQEPEAGENAALVAQGRKLFQEKTCVSCHTVRGHEGMGITGPDLTRVGARSTIAAGVLENTAERLGQWLEDPTHFKPGNKMYYGGYMVQSPDGTWKQNFSLNKETEIPALVAYLHSLK